MKFDFKIWGESIHFSKDMKRWMFNTNGKIIFLFMDKNLPNWLEAEIKVTNLRIGRVFFGYNNRTQDSPHYILSFSSHDNYALHVFLARCEKF